MHLQAIINLSPVCIPHSTHHIWWIEKRNQSCVINNTHLSWAVKSFSTLQSQTASLPWSVQNPNWHGDRKIKEIVLDREHEKAFTPTACLLLLLSRRLSHVCVLIDYSVDQTAVTIHRWPTCQRRGTTKAFLYMKWRVTTKGFSLYEIADTTWG